MKRRIEIDVTKHYIAVGVIESCAGCQELFDPPTWVLRVDDKLFHRSCARKIAVKMIEETARFDEQI